MGRSGLRASIQTDCRRSRKSLRADAGDRVTPLRRDLGQGSGHEQPVCGARVRQDQTGAVALLPAIGNQVQIQGARGVLGGASAPERLLDPPEGGHQRVRIVLGADDDHPVEKGRVARVGPGP